MPRMKRLPLTVTLVLLALLPAAACSGEPAPRAEAPTPPSTPSAAPSQPASTEQPTAPGSASAPTGQLVQLSYLGGQVTGATARVAVALGSTVTLEVTSDTADEIHLHGYDLSTPVTPGAPAVLTFTADIPGVFELELEESGVPLTQVEVS